MKSPGHSRDKSTHQAPAGGGESAKPPVRPDERSRDGGSAFFEAFGIRDWLLGLLLVAATLCAYRPCLQGQFVWDDDSWTTMLFPSLGGWRGLLTIWCHPVSLQQYYPLTATSFWFDYHLWNFWTPPYHFENVLLHGFAAVLLWRLLRRLEVPGAFLAGAIFAFHPVNVESAAWITERKNVLSLVLYLAALLMYGRFAGFWKDNGCSPVGAAAASVRRDRAAYALALLLFVGALLAKTTALSLPAVLLLIGWWKRGKIRWRADVLPVLPFFVFAVAMSVATAWLEKNHLMAQGPEWNLTFGQRCLVAGRALWFYAGKIVWPFHLCFVYPRWEPDVRAAWQWLYPATALGALLALWLARKRLGRGPATAVFFFAGTLFPLLGFFDSYFMRYSFVCDHWVYLSGPGLIALASALATLAAKRLRSRRMFPGLAAGLLAALAVLTWHQSAIYASSETLYRDTLAQNPKSDLARQNLGELLLQKGEVDEAIAQFRIGLADRPDEAIGYNNLGNALLAKGEVSEAVPILRRAVELDPTHVKARFNLGDALRRLGRMDDAVAELKKGLELQPDHAGGRDYLGTIYLETGRVDDAIAQLKMAVELDPALVHARYNLAEAFMRKGRLDEAIAQYEKALEIEPDQARVRIDLGIALYARGRGAAAVAQFQKVLELQPDNADALNNLAWVLATSPENAVRNGPRAVELALRADRLSGGANPAFLTTLAAAYAEAGRFPEALAVAQRALELALAHSNTGLAQVLRSQISLYQAGAPYHMPAPKAPNH